MTLGWFYQKHQESESGVKIGDLLEKYCQGGQITLVSRGFALPAPILRAN